MLFNCTVGKVVEGADTSADSCGDHSKNSLKLLPLSFERVAGSSKTCSGALAVSGLVCQGVCGVFLKMAQHRVRSMKFVSKVC